MLVVEEVFEFWICVGLIWDWVIECYFVEIEDIVFLVVLLDMVWVVVELVF